MGMVCGGKREPRAKVTYGAKIVECVKLRAQSSVNAKKLLVHYSSKREAAEGFHTSVVHHFRVLMLAL